MKKAITTAVLITAVVSFVMGQGSLTPPGAPTPGMKTLAQIDAAVAQVEPRFAITNLPHTINQAGSYYLDRNLLGSAGNSGITINANDVTLDLNGFRLVGIGGSLDGITVSGARTGLSIRNGSIRNWSQHGVNAWNASGARVTDITVSSSAANGLMLGENGMLMRCVAMENGGQGIRLAANCRANACQALRNDDSGIFANDGCIVTDCHSISNDEGINMETAGIVSGCTVRNNNRNGIYVTFRCRVSGNLCENNGAENNGASIHAKNNGNRIEGNMCMGADCGLDVDGVGNYVADNTVIGNTDNYDVVAGNHLNLLLGEIPETLDWPCSVKFAGTLMCSTLNTDGITVNADDVTIDLDGHTLIGPGASSGHGIYQINTLRNLTVLNGKVVEWRGDEKVGIYAGKSSRIHGIQAATNSFGIYASNGSTINECATYNNGDVGISTDYSCTISDCTANNNGDDGIFTMSGCTINNCTAYDNGDNGIFTQNGSTVCNCAVKHNGNNGIHATESCMISDCTATYNTGDGIIFTEDNRIVDNQCFHNGYNGDGAGIHATQDNNRIEGNNVTNNDRGIDVDMAGNFIVRNTASENTINYDVTGVQTIGPIITATGTITSTNPWANFSF